MTCPSLIVYVDDSDESDARVELACDLAVSFDSLLIGLSASLPQPPMLDPVAGMGDVLTLYRQMAEAEVERAGVRFRTIAEARSVRSEWRAGLSSPGDLLAAEARAADLVVIGQTAAGVPFRSPDPSDLILSAGRPVLLVPPVRARSPVGEPALVAWKDTRESRRAVAAALPLLRRASRVDVVEVAATTDMAAAEARVRDVCEFLGRHQIEAAAVPLDGGGEPTTVRILAEAVRCKAGLVVAGGYGHGRMREWMLGGVTRSLLTHSDVCVLMAH
jgi:nucleotide-binding universal stress UspA family protein